MCASSCSVDLSKYNDDDDDKSLGNHVVSPKEEKERLRWEGLAEREGFKR